MSTLPGTRSSLLTFRISTTAVFTPIACIRCGESCTGVRDTDAPEEGTVLPGACSGTSGPLAITGLAASVAGATRPRPQTTYASVPANTRQITALITKACLYVRSLISSPPGYWVVLSCRLALRPQI